MIRRRILASVGKSAPTARDYVQDGLLHLVDAIENVGYGVHEQSPDFILDLVGGKKISNFDLVADDYFTNHVTGSYGNGIEWDGGYVDIFGNVKTVELVLKRTNSSWGVLTNFLDNDYHYGSSGNWYLALPAASNGVFDSVNWWHTYNRAEFFTSSAQIPVGSRVSIAATLDRKAFQNGIRLSAVENVTATFGGSIGRKQLFCPYNSFYVEISALRVYNRSLSEDEILLNYAIDKARFNLPETT